ncbi:MAG: hypothetical protein AB1333_04960 [Patescibacteria group bacterium]
MGLFAKKCEYCREKIEKGNGVKRDVKIPGYVGTHSKNFCCDEHASKYEQEMEEYLRKPRKSSGCCG